MYIVSFDKWNKLNEQANQKVASVNTESKPQVSSSSSTTLKGGSSSESSAKPAESKTKTPQSTAAQAIFISDNIAGLFHNASNYFSEFKGVVNDYEAGALNKFNYWWNRSVNPKLSKLPSTDRNVQTIIRIKQDIQKALSGEQLSDTVSWKIFGDNGMSKEYTVDTDF